MQCLATGSQPIVNEGRLDLRDHRPLYPEMGATPVSGSLGIAAPVVGDACATDEPDTSVNHHQLTVCSVIEAARTALTPRRAASTNACSNSLAIELALKM